MWAYTSLIGIAAQQQAGGAPPASTILPQMMRHGYEDADMRQIRAGTTDVSVVIRIIDAGDGTPETGVAFDTGGIDLWYRREGAASTDITEATLSALTDAHSDGGILHINDGLYRLDLPDAACAASAAGVQIGGTVTGMVVLAPYIELVAYNPYDTVRLGLTTLPNAAAEAAGGLYTRGSGAGQINQANNGRVDTDVAAIATNAVTASALAADAVTEIQSGLATAAALDTVDNLLDNEIGALTTAVADLPTNAELATALAAADDAVLAAIAALNNLSAAQVNAEVVDALATDTYAEPTGVPAATATLAAKLNTLYMMSRNRVDVTASKKTFYDDGNAAEFEKDLSDDGTTYSESEANAL